MVYEVFEANIGLRATIGHSMVTLVHKPISFLYHGQIGEIKYNFLLFYFALPNHSIVPQQIIFLCMKTVMFVVVVFAPNFHQDYTIINVTSEKQKKVWPKALNMKLFALKWPLYPIHVFFGCQYREYFNRSPVARGDQIFVLAIPKKGIGDWLATGHFPFAILESLAVRPLAHLSLIKIKIEVNLYFKPFNFFLQRNLKRDRCC